MACGRPIIVGGDFNAEPTEPVYRTMKSHKIKLKSGYFLNGKEPPYTTWKVPIQFFEIFVFKCLPFLFFCWFSFPLMSILSSSCLTFFYYIYIVEVVGAFHFLLNNSLCFWLYIIFISFQVREEGEICHTIDYIFHSNKFKPVAFLEFPDEDSLGPERVPSLSYPSDHFSLLVDFELNRRNSAHWPLRWPLSTSFTRSSPFPLDYFRFSFLIYLLFMYLYIYGTNRK